MSSTVKVRKRRAFSAIPDDILEDTRMRTETRLVLGWLIGRPDGWQVRVGHVQRVLGLSERRWATTRKELEAFGYLQQIRRQNGDGKFVWEHIVSDVPMINKEGTEEVDAAIPPKPQDGQKGRKTIPLKTMDGSPMPGERGDITTSSNQDNLNTSPPYPLPHQAGEGDEPLILSSRCFEEARDCFDGYDIYALEAQWKAWIKQGNRDKPRNPDRAFMAWAERYVGNHPLPYGGGF